MSEEIWKLIPGFSKYQASNLGRIRSETTIRKPNKTSWGYLDVELRGDDGRKRKMKVHRLILMAFVGLADKQCNHINGIKTDNRLENLEYCTRLENMRHARKKGLYPAQHGTKNPNVKLTLEQVREIRANKSVPSTEWSRRFGVRTHTIRNILRGVSWKNIL